MRGLTDVFSMETNDDALLNNYDDSDTLSKQEKAAEQLFNQDDSQYQKESHDDAQVEYNNVVLNDKCKELKNNQNNSIEMKTTDNEITKISQSVKSNSNESMNDNSSDGHKKQ